MRNDQFLIEMGKRIAGRRKELQLTQEKVAERMGISLQSVSCIELGKKAIRPDNLVNLCMALNTTADYILTGAKPPDQLSAIARELSALSDEDYKMVEDFIHRLGQSSSASERPYVHS